MADTLLETERLRLRRFCAVDLDHLCDLDNDPRVMRYINGGEPASREDLARRVLPLFMTYRSDVPILGFWATEERHQGGFLGWFAFRPGDDHDPTDVTLGYRFQQAAWGAGYATEGARALIDAGFSRHGIQRVRATTYEQNKASRRVLEKLGLRRHRQFRYGAEDLQQSDTATTTDLELWDGYDLEYLLERSDWTLSPG